MNPKLSVIIPLLNEEGNINEITQRLLEAISEIQLDYEIIFVNDGSTDRSWEYILRLHQNNNKIKGICFSRNFGHQYALTAGIKASTGDIVFMLDADLQHPPELLKSFYQKITDGYEIVAGKRDGEEKISFIKRFLSKKYYLFFNSIGNTNMIQGTSDFRMITKRIADFLKRLPENNKFYRALLPWSGYSTYYLPYVANKRFKGKAKYNFLKSFKMGLKGITSFSTFPLYFSIYLGFFFAVLSFLYGIYAVYVKVILKSVPPGFTDIVASILFLGGLQLINIGINGLYISKIVDQTNGRPEYIIKEQCGL